MKQANFVLPLILIPLLFSCASKKGATVVKAPSSLAKISKLYAYIPAGNVFHHYDSELKEWKHDSVDAFLISPTEVSNLNYLEFLYFNKSDTAAFKANYPDTTVWTDELLYAQPYMDHYFNHPAYKGYPVVGITKQQAEAYCIWLTQALAISFPNTKIKARLPTQLEWIRAARGAAISVYPLGNNLKLSSGQHLYNYHQIGERRISYNDSTELFEVKAKTIPASPEDDRLITTEVQAYWPNSFGLYNVSGNVAELIGDKDMALGGSWVSPGYDIRVDSAKTVKEAKSTVGFRVVLEILE
jgi:formylglycine-generating enzyme required for sulfatase activity